MRILMQDVAKAISDELVGVVLAHGRNEAERTHTSVLIASRLMVLLQ